MGIQLSDRQIFEIGETYKRINNVIGTANALGIAPATVNKYLKRLGLNRGIGGNQDKQRKITDEQILDCITMGLTRQQIADYYGVHVENLARRMKKLGAHAKHKQVDAQEWHFSQSSECFVKRHLKNDFEFIALKGKKYRLKCRKCGCVFERSKSSISKSTTKCPACKKIQKQERELTRPYYMGEFKRCECCGKSFFAFYKTSAYCSDVCKRKAKRMRRKERDPQYKKGRNRCKRQNGYISRAKKYGCKYEYGITIKSVFKRDGGICKICGQPCDISDRKYGGFGPYYPSVDHIIPLSKGGSHTWDNVQLTHMICNSYKRDLDDNKVIDEVIQNAKIQTA